MVKPSLEHVSAAVRRLNPELFSASGSVVPIVDSKPTGALVKSPPAEPKRTRRVQPGVAVTITLTAYLGSRIDPDNLGTAFKPLQDAIAAWLGVDDGDTRILWQYGYVMTHGRPETTVKIEIERPNHGQKQQTDAH